jgi:heme A synthase
MQPEDIFTIANIIFTIATTRLFLQVIRNRDTLKDFELIGSFLTTVAIVVMSIGFISVKMYVSLLFIIPTLAFWAFVTVSSLNQLKSRRRR